MFNLSYQVKTKNDCTKFWTYIASIEFAYTAGQYCQHMQREKSKRSLPLAIITMSPPYRIGDVEVLNYKMISADQNLEVIDEAYHDERHDRSQSVRNYE